MYFNVFVGVAAYLVLGCSKLLSNLYAKMAARETTVDPSANCKKCHNHYDDPRMLPCLHSFCKSCVGQLVIQTGSKKTVRCPTCYSTTPLPLKGVDAFPRNVRLSYEAAITKYEAQIKSKTPPSCDECRREPPLETVSFCCTRRSFLCKECHAQHILSRKAWLYHQIVVLEEARKKDVRKELKNFMVLDNIKCGVHEENELKFRCITCNTLVCLECTVAHHQGHKFEEVNTFLTRQKQSVFAKNVTERLMKNVDQLEESIKNGKSMHEKILTSKKSVNEAIGTAFDELVNTLLKRKEELLAKSSEISTAKETSLTLQLEELTSLKDQMVACTAVVAEVQESYNDTELLSVVTTLQTRVQELTQRFDNTSLELREDDVLLLALDVDPLRDGITELGSVAKTQPTRPRDYSSIVNPVMIIPTTTPDSIAIHHSGDIFVTNFQDHKIEVFDEKGNKKPAIGTQGNANGQFKHPTGVAITGDVIFVTESTGCRVQKLTTGGEYLSQFGSSGSLSGPQFSNPWGCSVSSNGILCVADQNNKRVLAFNSDGSLSHIVSCSKNPKSVAIDSNGNIFVGSDGVEVFDQAGNFIQKFGKGTLSKPDGIAVDQHGYCIVGEKRNVHIFDPQDKLIHTIRHKADVTGVALDHKEFVYVSEYNGNKIFKY